MQDAFFVLTNVRIIISPVLELVSQLQIILPLLVSVSNTCICINSQVTVFIYLLNIFWNLQFLTPSGNTRQTMIQVGKDTCLNFIYIFGLCKLYLHIWVTHFLNFQAIFRVFYFQNVNRSLYCKYLDYGSLLSLFIQRESVTQ